MPDLSLLMIMKQLFLSGLGTDFVSNYYEYEMPVKISPWGNNATNSVWPQENNLTINLNHLKDLKKNRNSTEFSNFDEIFSI